MLEKVIVVDEKAVIDRLKSELEKRANEALNQREVFRVGLSGGSVLNYLSEAILQIDSDLGKWKFFFCDERFVAEENADSTYGAYKRTLLPRCSALQIQQFVNINTKVSLEECALDYERKIMKEFRVDVAEDGAAAVVPQFDVLLLGMGPDGHTCSLFPGHALLKERKRLVTHISDSPKPPPQRITMTLPLINAAKCCIFAMCGESKAEMVQKVFVERQPDLPASMIKPQEGCLIAIFDEAAGKSLINK